MAGTRGKNSFPRETKQYWNCGQIGHLKKDCPQKKKGGANNNSNNSNKNKKNQNDPDHPRFKGPKPAEPTSRVINGNTIRYAVVPRTYVEHPIHNNT